MESQEGCEVALTVSVGRKKEVVGVRGRNTPLPPSLLLLTHPHTQNTRRRCFRSLQSPNLRVACAAKSRLASRITADKTLEPWAVAAHRGRRRGSGLPAARGLPSARRGNLRAQVTAGARSRQRSPVSAPHTPTPAPGLRLPNSLPTPL